MRTRLRVIAVVAVLLSATTAEADILRIKERFAITLNSGNTLERKPGYVLEMSDWDKIDSEFKRLQTQETRLTAENESLKKSAESAGPSITGWVGVGLGLALGLYIGYKL